MGLKEILLQTKQNILTAKEQELQQALNQEQATTIANKVKEIEEKKANAINAYAQKRNSDIQKAERDYNAGVLAVKEEAEKKKNEFINSRKAIIEADINIKYAAALKSIDAQLAGLEKE